MECFSHPVCYVSYTVPDVFITLSSCRSLDGQTGDLDY